MTPRPHGSESPLSALKGVDEVITTITDLKARVEELEAVLREARPYVFNRTQGDDWRAETAQELLERVDVALRGSVPAGEEDGDSIRSQVAREQKGDDADH